MKNNISIPLKQWSNQFTSVQKNKARKANNYYVVVEEFKKTRKDLGLTQQQLADRVNIDRSVIAKIESGARNTTLNSLMMFAEAMDRKLKISFV